MALTFIERCAVEDEGEGPAVVCVHGLGGSSNTFTPLIPALARHRVVRIDLPGSGRSHRAEGLLSMTRYADLVLSVCARLNVTRAHFVGHSMGNIVLQHLAVQSPKLVAGLALFGPLVVPPDTSRTAIRARGEKAKAEGAAGMHEIALALLNASISADTRARLPLAVAFVRESLMRQDPDGYARSCFALAEATAAAVDRIECAGAARHRRRGRRRPAAGRACDGRAAASRALGARGRAAQVRTLDAGGAAGGMHA